MPSGRTPDGDPFDADLSARYWLTNFFSTWRQKCKKFSTSRWSPHTLRTASSMWGYSGTEEYFGVRWTAKKLYMMTFWKIFQISKIFELSITSCRALPLDHFLPAPNFFNLILKEFSAKKQFRVYKLYKKLLQFLHISVTFSLNSHLLNDHGTWKLNLCPPL